MLSEKMYDLGAKSSVIREIFEYGKMRKAVVGEENVFDFSLGNPSVPAPENVREVISGLLEEMPAAVLHGYTSAVGDAETRKAIALDLNKRFGTAFSENNLYMTCGAAASLSICFRALTQAEDEIIIFAPYFPEYKVFIESAGAKAVIVRCSEETLQLDLEAFEKAVTEKTKAVVINSPNNPSGVVISEDELEGLCRILEKKQQEFGKEIFLVSDEPYRELVYGGVKVPFVTKYYNNTLVCYSYSKSLSLPGERIGYILVPDEVCDSQRVYKAICGAGRSLGYVCAPSMMQYVVRKCCGMTADISVYQKNRDLLVGALTRFGFSCAKPEGAFYLFLRSPEKSAEAFCERAKALDILAVPGDSFGFPGYVRLSYCVSTQMIEGSLPAFEALAREYNLK